MEEFMEFDSYSYFEIISRYYLENDLFELKDGMIMRGIPINTVVYYTQRVTVKNIERNSFLL